MGYLDPSSSTTADARAMLGVLRSSAGRPIRTATSRLGRASLGIILAFEWSKGFPMGPSIGPYFVRRDLNYGPLLGRWLLMVLD